MKCNGQRSCPGMTAAMMEGTVKFKRGDLMGDGRQHSAIFIEGKPIQGQAINVNVFYYCPFCAMSFRELLQDYLPSLGDDRKPENPGLVIV